MLHRLSPQRTGGNRPSDCPNVARNPSRREIAERADLVDMSGAGQYRPVGARPFPAGAHSDGCSCIPDIFGHIDRPLNMTPELMANAYVSTACPRASFLPIRARLESFVVLTVR